MSNCYKILSLLLCVFALTPEILKAQTSAEELIAYYPFDGNVSDVSGNNFHASVNGAVLTTDRFNTPNSAYYFDGINDNIILPNSFDLRPKTISFWFNAFTIDNSSRVIYVSDNPNLQFGITAIEIKKIAGVNKIATHITSSRDTAEVSPNTWYNFIITINTDSTHFYLNGVKIKSRKITSYPKSNTGVNQTIVGSHRLGNTNSIYFHGKIDDVKIYNRVFSSKEILEINDLSALLDLGPDICLEPGEKRLLTANGFSTYLWSNGASGSSIEINGPGTYSVTTTDQLGKNYTDEITVAACTKLKIPNIITPNGDDVNDFFKIEEMSAAINYTLEVYNRWGKLVHSSGAYQNDWKGDGLSAGVYFYHIKEDVSGQTYKGWVEIIQ